MSIYIYIFNYVLLYFIREEFEKSFKGTVITKNKFGSNFKNFISLDTTLTAKITIRLLLCRNLEFICDPRERIIYSENQILTPQCNVNLNVDFRITLNAISTSISMLSSTLCQRHLFNISTLKNFVRKYTDLLILFPDPFFPYYYYFSTGVTMGRTDCKKGLDQSRSFSSFSIVEQITVDDRVTEVITRGTFKRKLDLWLTRSRARTA